MPRELIATAPRTPELRDYDDPPLNAGQIRIRTELASPKHGTELVAYRDDPVASRPYDPAWGAVIPKPPELVRAGFPMRLGNMAVGVVTETGPDVSRFKAGDRVFGHFPIRETQTVDETRADPLPDGLSAWAALCLDPVVMALAIRDAGIALGDRVAVFGLGAIGLVALQLARLAGADQVIAVDPLANRREVALALGADMTLDPSAGDGDAGLAIRRLGLDGASPVPVANRPATPLIGGYTERTTQDHQLGVDVALETSGSIAALHAAIRATRFGGTVCVVSFLWKGGRRSLPRRGVPYQSGEADLGSRREPADAGRPSLDTGADGKARAGLAAERPGPDRGHHRPDRALRGRRRRLPDDRRASRTLDQARHPLCLTTLLPAS